MALLCRLYLACLVSLLCCSHLSAASFDTNRIEALTGLKGTWGKGNASLLATSLKQALDAQKAAK